MGRFTIPSTRNQLDSANSTRRSALGTQTVRIFVGAERKCYVVHTDLLISLSDYFLNALTSVNDKGEEECVDSYDMPEEDPVVVGLLVEWLYRGSFPDPEHQNHVSARRGRKKAEKLPTMDHCHYSTWFEKEHPNSNSRDQDSFIHICFQPCFRALSPEEIRLQDYNTGLRYQEGPTTPPPTIISDISKSSPTPLTQQEVIDFGGLQPNRITASPFSKPFEDSQPREVPARPFQGPATSDSIFASGGLSSASFSSIETPNGTKSSAPTATTHPVWSFGGLPQKPVSNNSSLPSFSPSSTSMSAVADKNPTIYDEFANENYFFRSDLMAKVWSSLAQISSATNEVVFENYYVKDEK
jgi:hypothetical protein